LESGIMSGENNKWNDVEVLIVGAGTMGASLAQAYAQSGFHTGILDISEEILENAVRIISEELERARGRIFSDEQTEAIKDRILTTTDYEAACRGRNLRLVIESATERLDIKKKIFTRLDKLCAPDVVLASNSSSLDIDAIADITGRPDRVVWMHYFYLPHKNRAGEYAGSKKASVGSKQLAAKYLKLAGKIPTPILSSRRGGAADIVFVSLLLEATRMLEEGYDVASVEEAGRLAYGMPMGFLTLMDVTGLEVGLYSMESFSQPFGPEDELISVYGNFFSPPQVYCDIVKRQREAEDKSSVRWVSEDQAAAQASGRKVVERLRDRFLGVGFMTASEVVDSGVIRIADFEQLAQNAFLWREGPFTLMNKMGVREANRLVKERAELAAELGTDFPIPENLKRQAEMDAPWAIGLSPVVYGLERGGSVARITLSNPKFANALDNDVFSELNRRFIEAYDDDKVGVVVFDTAPIKTFIAGANVPDFIKRIKEGALEAIREDTAAWQEVMFHVMTGTGKPKIAVVDGQAFGGGVEVALAFANDPDSTVIVTERTSYTLPETRLGIYPGLRGTLLLPDLINRPTGDAELAVAMARYYILAAGTTTSSARLLYHLGLADMIVPACRRDDAVAAVAEAVLSAGGKAPTREQLTDIGVETLKTELTFAEKEEIRVVKDLFLQPDLLPTMYTYARGFADPFVAGEWGDFVRRIARRVYFSSPHAVFIADQLINQGFADTLAGVDIEQSAQRELNDFLIPIFRHPDALEGLSAMVERRFPNFNRRFPL
jgi:enoyl-CoA hydratase/3-hydroxyacyl-CoA dehydrogenase